MTDATSAEPKKRPAFQFYPGDWRKDVQLRSCSIAARGLWVDLMCVMHDCEPYGHLVLNGRPMTHAQISGQIGLPPAQVKKLLQELIENGVARLTDEGVIFSKRMVHDEQVRNARAAGGKDGAEHGQKGAEHGRKGGRPKTDKGGFRTPLPFDEEPPPSSSSSSSSSNNTPKPPPGAGDLAGFAEFWAAWPKSSRKGGKADCEAVWRKQRLEPISPTIVAHVKAMAATEGWTKQAGEFIPAPVVYLRGKRWDGAEVEEPAGQLFAGAL